MFLSAAILKSQLLKIAATVMTFEFGTIHNYSSPFENSRVLQFFTQMKN